MTWWRILGARLRSLFRRHRDADLQAELAGYLAVETARHRQTGLTEAAARRAARVEAGSLAAVTDAVRAGRVGAAVGTTLRDLRYGARVLGRAPGYAAVVVLTMALGIGTSASMFGVIHAVLWRPLPYPDPDRLVVVDADARGVRSAGVAPGEARDLSALLHTVTAVAMAEGVDASLTVDGQMDRVPAASATDAVASLLGMSPMWLGRPLADHQDEGQVVRSVVISHDLWMRRFHQDPQVVGRHVEVNNLDVQVVGVTRPGFHVFLPADGHVEETVDIWFPAGFGTSRAYRQGSLVARLAPDATLGQAQAELDAAALRFVAADRAAYPDGQLRFRIAPLRTALTEASRPALVALGAAVAFVLLIACVNVANVMLARVKTRDRELSVRQALGASRLRILRQLAAEHVLVTAGGAVLGWIVATESVALIGWLRPPKLPRLGSVVVDPTMLGLAIAATSGVALLFSLLPAWIASRAGAPTVVPTGRAAAMAPTRGWQRALVTAEVALSMVPLVAAGLMGRTFLNLVRAPLGFEAAQRLTASVPLDFRRYADLDARLAFYGAAIDRVRALPGVDAVSAGAPLPLSALTFSERFSTADAPAILPVRATELVAWPGWLSVMGIRLRAGRDFTPDDLSAKRHVALVDEGLARTLFAGHALGRPLTMQSAEGVTTLEVIGITASFRTRRVRDASGPSVVVPFSLDPVELSLVVKTTAPLGTLGPAVKQAVESLGGGRPVFDLRPLEALVGDSIAEERFTLLILAGFATAALLLAAVGLFGTLSYFLSQRLPEFGVRLALGATAGRLVGLVLGEGARLTAVGLVLGLAGSAAVVGLLRTLLYGVAPLDAPTLAAVVTGVTIVALVAMARPAWRAGHVDPTITLRGE